MVPSVRVSHVHLIAIDNRKIVIPNTRTVDGVPYFSLHYALLRNIVRMMHTGDSENRNSKLADLSQIVNRAKRTCVEQSMQPIVAAPKSKAATKRLPRHRGHHVAAEMRPELSIIDVVVPAMGAAPKTTLNMLPNIDIRTSFFFELSEATVKYFVLAASNIGNRSDDSRIDSRDEDKEGEVDQDEDDHDGSGDGSGMGEDGGNLQDRESQA